MALIIISYRFLFFMISLTSLALLPELAAVVEDAAAAALDKDEVEAVVPVKAMEEIF